MTYKYTLNRSWVGALFPCWLWVLLFYCWHFADVAFVVWTSNQIFTYAEALMYHCILLPFHPPLYFMSLTPFFFQLKQSTANKMKKSPFKQYDWWTGTDPVMCCHLIKCLCSHCEPFDFCKYSAEAWASEVSRKGWCCIITAPFHNPQST